MKKNFFKKIFCPCIIILSMLLPMSLKVNAATSMGSFGTGVGIKNWPSQVNAPYVDMVNWVTKQGYYVGDGGGPANLSKLSQDTGIKFFNLAFIQSTGSVSNGKINWGWGGYSILSEGKMDSQYDAIKQSLKDLRALGGDATISFGGANGVAFWQTSQDVDVLYNTYLDIVNGYGLTRIDLDVEGGAQNKQNNIANAKAIKKLQDETGVDVSLTLPVLPSGLTQTQLDVLEAYLSNNVNLKCINIMAMCYGNSSLYPNENYGTASVRAMESTKNQIKDYYKKYANTTLSDSEAYAKLGVTASIGYESGSHPIFIPEWSQLIVNHAKANNIGMTSYWSLNRDALLDNNSGISSQYEHSKIFATFGSSEVGPIDPVEPSNNLPVISGVNDKQIKIGDSFNPLAGVKAMDKEDGDLTSKIVVNGKVDTSKAGKYTLTYSVIDKDNNKTEISCCITVKEQGEEYEQYDPNKTYIGGEIVIYKGEVYKCMWWTQGSAPGAEQWGPWQKVDSSDENVPTVNTKPEIIGVKDQTIKIGSTFNALTGIKASDKEDGDLTSKIIVNGKVDTSKAGKYTLTYSVVDKNGSKSEASCTITVEEKEEAIYEEYDSNKTYTGGEIVIYKGEVYKCKWWTHGNVPGAEQWGPWEKIN